MIDEIKVGRVYPKDGETEAECAHCDVKIRSNVEGKAAKLLMEHYHEEHV